MKRLERVVESVAGRPRWFADDDLPPTLRQLEFVNGGDGALPSADIADNQEMFREVYRVKNREDRKRRVRPLFRPFFWVGARPHALGGLGGVYANGPQLGAPRRGPNPPRLHFPTEK